MALLHMFKRLAEDFGLISKGRTMTREEIIARHERIHRERMDSLSDSALLEVINDSARRYFAQKDYVTSLQRRLDGGSMTRENFNSNTYRARIELENLPGKINTHLEEMQRRVEQDGISQHPEFQPLIARLATISAAELGNTDVVARCIRNIGPNGPQGPNPWAKV